MQINQACIEFLKGYFSTHERSQKTKKAYCSDLKQFQGFVESELDVSLLRGSHIENWAAHLREKDYSPASIRRKIIVLKVFCSYWVRNGILTESPFWRVKISYGRIEQLPRTLTETEMKGLLTQAHQDRSINNHNPNETNKRSAGVSKPSSRDYRLLRNLALIELLFATGMRVGEVSSVDIKDFLLEEAIFKIKGKGGRERLAFIVDEVTLKIQMEHLKVRAKIESDSPALFLNAVGNRLSTQGIAKIISQLREDGGIKRHVTPHMLRHTVATLLLRNGVDIRVVQEFLGHASIATTQRYVHIVKEHMIRELRNRHPSLSFRDEKEKR
ncbi:MAG: tyrosine-type recombinase/integrase [Pyrinomonadaceae bacterium]